MRTVIFRILVSTLVIINPDLPAFSQFTRIETPEFPGIGTSFDQEIITFGDPDHGFFSARAYFSPSSGSAQYCYATSDGGLTWRSSCESQKSRNQQLSVYADFIDNYFLQAINGDTCYEGYQWELGQVTVRISEDFCDFHSLFGSPNSPNKLAHVFAFSNDLIYLTIDDSYHELSIIYKLEGDVTTDILTTFQDTLMISATHFISPNTGFLITHNSSGSTFSIYKTTDQCQSIRPVLIASGKITGIDFFNDSTGMICGAGGMLYKTVNTGETWEAVNSGVTNNISCLDFVSDQAGYFAGDSGMFYRTTDLGASWTQISTPSIYNITGISMFEAGLGYLYYQYGICYRYDVTAGIEYIHPDPIKLYPNPASTFFIVELPFNGSEAASICLKNVSGQLLLKQQFTGNQTELDLGQIQPGLYILTVVTDENRWTGKVVIK